ncbi:MAG TPA: DUF1016 family protein [Candidatus Caccenecus avistercoris]|nr:DUF1016 family protein [Candidatus Caccenecus avistercoris]
MKEQQYYEEIEHLIKRNEISKRVRKLEENYSLVETYWHIGKIIVEAQGGSTRAKYGNELIKKWSIKLTELYGKGYDASNLKRFRQFYLVFRKDGAVRHQLSWTHIRKLLPIKDENKRNYFINLCIKNNLSERELTREIKSNVYERLVDKPDKIDIIVPVKQSITTDMKNPIIIPVKSEVASEHDLELNILANLDFFFKQLGNGFLYAGHQYKISDGKNSYYVDILLFNYKMNAFVVVELKLRSLRKEDKAQMEFYMKLIDEQVKEAYHNKTIGIIISKESDEFIVNFVRQDDIIPLSYEIEQVMLN